MFGDSSKLYLTLKCLLTGLINSQNYYMIGQCCMTRQYLRLTLLNSFLFVDTILEIKLLTVLNDFFLSSINET